jgi:hypothetical protein
VYTISVSFRRATSEVAVQERFWRLLRVGSRQTFAPTFFCPSAVETSSRAGSPLVILCQWCLGTENACEERRAHEIDRRVEQPLHEYEPP